MSHPLEDGWEKTASLEDARLAVGELKLLVVGLEENVRRLRKAGRYVTVALGGAADDSEDGWTREEIFRLFEYVCLQWPELDPRRPVENQNERKG